MPDLGVPEIEYTSLVYDLKVNGFYFKLSNKIYLPPQLKENPELHSHVIKHEKQHYENGKRFLPIRLFLDILLDYKDAIKQLRMKRLNVPYSFSEEIHSLFYDFFTFPLGLRSNNRFLKNSFIFFIFTSWLSWVLFIWPYLVKG